jgi:glycosyltransferase involved in cell wall biosynthesis
MGDMNTLTPHPGPLTSDRSGSVAPPASTSTSRAAAPAVEIVIPVHNEQLALEHGVRTLHAYLIQTFAFSFRITIADNASTDATLDVARALAQELDGVEVLYLDRKGRGHALRCAWSRSDATVLAYMDVDLSTDLAALDGLLTPLLEGRGDLAIGSRLAAGADVTRGLRRELISRGYNLLLRALLGVTFSDAQCGFKAGRREVVQALLDDVQDDDWFFDTELLYLAQQRKLAIHEVPVRWVEDRDSRVEIVATAREDLRGVIRLRAAARVSREHPLEHLPESSHRRLARLHLGRLRSRSTGLPT